MKIRLLISRVGATRSYSVGEEIDVSNKEGARLCEAGKAVPVRQEPAVEKAARGKAKAGK